jgi:hypothetical protein
VAYDNPGRTITLPANADLSANQYYFVKANSSGNAVVAAAGDLVAGVLQNKPAAAGRAAAIMIDGVTKVIAGGTITPGASVESDSSGKAVAANAGTVDTSDAGAGADPVVGGNVAGMYLGTSNAASGDLIPVLLTRGGVKPTTQS